jgi:hypothetical protein
MDAVTAVAIKQAQGQSQMAMSMVKQANKAEQAIVNMIADTAASGSRGQNLNILV